MAVKKLSLYQEEKKYPFLNGKKQWSKIEKHNGWVPSMLISSSVPKSKTSLLNRKKVDLSKNVRRRASAFTHAAAARGLKENSADFFKDLEGGNYKALKKMESHQVSSHRGQRFLLSP